MKSGRSVNMSTPLPLAIQSVGSLCRDIAFCQHASSVDVFPESGSNEYYDCSSVMLLFHIGGRSEVGYCEGVETTCRKTKRMKGYWRHHAGLARFSSFIAILSRLSLPARDCETSALRP